MLLLLLPLSVFGQTWEQITDFSGAERDDGVCFSIGGKAYCGTGMDLGFTVTSDFYAFDFSTEAWSPIASMPDSSRRQYATSFVHNGDGYVFGGINSSGDYLNDLWKYSPTSDSWTNLFGLPELGRSGASCFVIEDTVYIVGGKTDLTPASSEVWAYVIPSNGWTQKTNLPSTGIWRGVGFEHIGKGYVGLGLDNGLQENSAFYRYHSDSDTWELVPELITAPRAYVAMAKIDDKVFMYGGANGGTYSNSFERINMNTLTIDNLTTFPSAARRGASGFASATDFFIVNGVTLTERLNETWVVREVLALDGQEPLNSSITYVQVGNQLAFDIGTEAIVDDFLVCTAFGTPIQTCSVLNGKPIIDITSLSAGIYYYEIRVGSNSLRGKVPVVH